MKYLMLLLLASCANSVSVPKKVEQTGTVNTINTIRIEIVLPEFLSNNYKSQCESQFTTQAEIDKCIADLQSTYVGQIINLISQFQNTVHPSPTPVAQ